MAKAKADKGSDDQSTYVLDIFDDSFVDDIESDSRLLAQEIGLNDLDTAISSGSLVLDLILGGGHKSGKVYAYTGPEHGGKTTIVKMAMGQALRTIPYRLKGVFLDGEGTFDPIWAGHIWDVEPNELHKVIGLRNAKTKDWLISPQIRYYKPQFGEQGLVFLTNLVKNRPEKVKLDNRWWYLYVPSTADEVRKNGSGWTKDTIRDTLTREVEVNGKTKKVKLWDASLYSDTGCFYVPVPNNYGGPELIIGIDSFTSLTPKQIALQDNEALGAQARMFSRYLTPLKSLIASRGITLLGTKQIRQKIGGYGDSEYNPGGETLKHVDDVRCRIGTVSNKIKTGKSNYNVQVEGDDEYRYFHIRNKKNKTFVPFKECDGRWWTQHGGSSGFGIDPVFDVLKYLEMTGQKTAVKKGFSVTLQEDSKAAERLKDIVFSYDSFKDSILEGCIYDAQGNVVSKKFNLREYCGKQLHRDGGYGLQLFLRDGDLGDEGDGDDEEDGEE